MNRELKAVYLIESLLECHAPQTEEDAKVLSMAFALVEVMEATAKGKPIPKKSLAAYIDWASN